MDEDGYVQYTTVWMRGGVQRKGDRRGSAQFLRRLNTSPNGACNTATPKTLCTRLNVLRQKLFFPDLAPQRNGDPDRILVTDPQLAS